MAENTTDSGMTAVPPTPKPGRRRFLGAGVGATPAFLALASQPALGTTCFTPSRALSRNISASRGTPLTCSGQPPSHYYTTAPLLHRNWPTASGSPLATANFHSIFAGSQFNCQRTTAVAGQTHRQLTLLEVLNLPNRPSDLSATGFPTNSTLIAMARRTVAAYLNVYNNHVPRAVADPNRIIQIWAGYSQSGSYQVTAGVVWTPTQILDYYSANLIAPA